jgi:tryptophanyl-tRNA synthetase
MSKPVILTGLRANNDLHLGNYLGALLPIVQMQKKYAGKYQINLFVPDLHSFTTPIDHSQLYEQTISNARLFVASGLDLADKDTFVYRQSRIPAHSELTVILNCFTYMGELNRMTQFKEKSGVGKVKNILKEVETENYDAALADMHGLAGSQDYRDAEKELGDVLFNSRNKSVSVGLFDYPVLMASDILLYEAKYVPVGADQTQHVELARNIAIRMNNKFGEDLFSPPEAEKEQIAFATQDERMRVRDLLDPTKKMSKSDETGKGVIFLGDTPEVASKKVMGATTDSLASINYDYVKQPGISNLLDILSALTDTPIKDTVAKYQGQKQYGPLKEDVAKAVANYLKDFQAELESVDEKQLLDKLEESEKAMNQVANKTLLRAQKAVGLR